MSERENNHDERNHGVPPEEYAGEVFEDESPAAASAEEAEQRTGTGKHGAARPDSGSNAAGPDASAEAGGSAEPDASVESSAEPAVEPGAQPSVDDEALNAAALDLAAERLADLQRLTAEYKNFRRRTEENKVADRARAVGDAARLLFPVFDDLDLAEQHGDLVEGSAFATIAQKIRTIGEHLGIKQFGAKGDPFDPNIHEAVFQQPSPDVTVATVGQVVAPGFELDSTLLRAAKVVVLAPQEPAQRAATDNA